MEEMKDEKHKEHSSQKTCEMCGQPIPEYDKKGMPPMEKFEKMTSEEMRKYLPVKNNEEY